MDDAIKTQANLKFQNGLNLLNAGKLDAADTLLEQAYQLNPKNTDVLNLLGIRSYQKQNYKLALDFLNRANILAPESAETLSNLGLVHCAILNFSEALLFFDAALRVNRNIPEIYNNKGNALRGLHKLDMAKDAYEKAIALRPNYHEALSNYGAIFLDEGSSKKAIPLFEKAINANPNFASAFNNLGNAFTQLGQYEDAYECYERALQLQPSNLETCLNFGNALKKFKHYDAAIDCYCHALKIDANNPTIFFQLGELYYAMGEGALAKTYYGKTLNLNPDDLTAQFALALAQIPKVYKSLEEVATSREEFSKQLEFLQSLNQALKSSEKYIAAFSKHPFYLAYQAGNNRHLLSQFGALCIKQAELIHREIDLKIKQPEVEKIRIGIVSNHIFNHPVWHAITKGWVYHLNPEFFDIYLFNTNGVEDNETVIAKSKAFKYLNCGKSVIAAAEKIVNTGMDCLIYPEIGMDTTSKGLACLRLAPIQLASWGHPETSGLSTIDYFVSGELLEPDGAEISYSEKLICLPNIGTCIHQTSIEASKPNLESLGIRASESILICAGSPSKYMPVNDIVLIEIAKKLGQCQFVFFNFEENLTSILRERLHQAFSEAGLTSENYIRFIPFLKKDEFHGLMEEADLYLDTIDFSGFNTAAQAIECNLPIVTIEGEWMRGRLASAILRQLKLENFICKCHSEYIDLAVELIQNKSLREAYRTKILTSKESLFNDMTPIKALEFFLIQFARESRGGLISHPKSLKAE